jgi:hypothetical protein
MSWGGVYNENQGDELEHVLQPRMPQQLTAEEGTE